MPPAEPIKRMLRVEKTGRRMGNFSEIQELKKDPGFWNEVVNNMELPLWARMQGKCGVRVGLSVSHFRLYIIFDIYIFFFGYFFMCVFLSCFEGKSGICVDLSLFYYVFAFFSLSHARARARVRVCVCVCVSCSCVSEIVCMYVCVCMCVCVLGVCVSVCTRVRV